MIVLLAVQMAIIPRLRKPVLVLGRQRQLSARLLAGRIAETADGVNEIHVHGAANYERADISERLGHIFRIRFELYNKKFVAKFWNNLLSQATPFAIYLVGGYFAITGQMDVGAVVGVLLAYKDLPSPIKELIDWDQQRQDVQIKYEQVIDQFQPEGMMPPELQALPDGPPPPLGHELVLTGVTVSEDGRVKQLDSVTPDRCRPTPSVAVIGGSGSGKDVLGQVLARLVPPTAARSGSTARTSSSCPNTCWARAPPISARRPTCSRCRVRDNLLFGLKHRPIAPATYDDATARDARGVLARGRARRQSGARSQRRLDRLRAGRRHRPGRPAALHGAGAEAGRARRGHLFARPARRDRRRASGPTSPRRS